MREKIKRKQQVIKFDQKKQRIAGAMISLIGFNISREERKMWRGVNNIVEHHLKHKNRSDLSTFRRV